MNNLLTTVSFGGGNTHVKYFVINDSSSYYSLPNYFESKGNNKQFKIMQKFKFDLMNTSINDWQSVTYEITEDLTRISVNEMLVLDTERDPTKENSIVGNYYLEDLTPVEKIIDDRISEQRRYSARVKMRNLAVAQFRAVPSNKGKRVPPHISYVGGNEQNEGFKTILIKELKIGAFTDLLIKKLVITDDYNTLFRFEAEENLGKIE